MLHTGCSGAAVGKLLTGSLVDNESIHSLKLPSASNFCMEEREQDKSTEEWGCHEGHLFEAPSWLSGPPWR